MRRFYFALPRLLLRLAGGNSAPTEHNWLEANAVGAAMHFVVYLTAAHLLLGGRGLVAQLALLLPVTIGVVVFWSIYFYAVALLGKMLRVRTPPDRAQGFCVGVLTSACAWQLSRAGGVLGVIGSVWLFAVFLNLLAAGPLALLGPPAQEPRS
jgi:hypothetical protein